MILELGLSWGMEYSYTRKYRGSLVSEESSGNHHHCWSSSFDRISKGLISCFLHRSEFTDKCIHSWTSEIVWYFILETFILHTIYKAVTFIVAKFLCSLAHVVLVGYRTVQNTLPLFCRYYWVGFIWWLYQPPLLVREKLWKQTLSISRSLVQKAHPLFQAHDVNPFTPTCTLLKLICGWFVEIGRRGEMLILKAMKG